MIFGHVTVRKSKRGSKIWIYMAISVCMYMSSIIVWLAFQGGPREPPGLCCSII